MKNSLIYWRGWVSNKGPPIGLSNTGKLSIRLVGAAHLKKLFLYQEKMMSSGTRVASDQLEQSLINIAVESWRFSRLFARVVTKLDAGEASRYVNQLRYFQKKVEECLDATGLKLVNVEGQPFDAGMAASAVNSGDFGPDDVLLVDQMLEPIIMGPDGLKKQGTVMLRKVHS